MKMNNKGFTLLELALVMIIMGVMYAAVFSAFAHYQNIKKIETTEKTMKLLRGAFTEYAARTKHYPCPARRDLPTTDTNYGVADCTPTGLGLVRADTGRDVGEDPPPATPDNETILIGAIPFKTMEPELLSNKLRPQDVIDVWGNKYGYAVTELLVFTSTYNDAWGAIGVEDEYSESIISPENTAHLVIYSHGPNGKGAYTADGIDTNPCTFITLPPSPTPPPGPVMLDELENCDDDDGDFLSGLQNDSDISHYDDILNYQVNQISDLWTTAGTDEIQLSSGVTSRVNLYTNTNVGNVGVGVKNPIDEKLEFSSGFKVTDNVILSSVCSEGGGDCMHISAITGEEPEMQCDPDPIGNPQPGQGVKTISENRVKCAPIFSIPVDDSCDPGEYVNGITSSGTVTCAPLTPSP